MTLSERGERELSAPLFLVQVPGNFRHACGRTVTAFGASPDIWHGCRETRVFPTLSARLFPHTFATLSERGEAGNKCPGGGAKRRPPSPRPPPAIRFRYFGGLQVWEFGVFQPRRAARAGSVQFYVVSTRFLE